MDPRPYQATLDQYQAQADQHEAGVKLAEVEFQRYEQLLKTKSASKSDYDKALGLKDEAIAGLAAAKASIEQAKLDLGFTRIAAPISGKVGRRLLDVGNLIDPTTADTPLTTLVSVDPIYVLFNVDERSMMRYRTNKRDIPRADNEVPTIKDLKIPVYVGLDGEEGFPHEGMLDFTDNKVNPSTGTIPCVACCPIPNGFSTTACAPAYGFL
ncbi:MAG: efflux RND transporter periplasmic adaptor subunit [Planctomycetota bacterium]